MTKRVAMLLANGTEEAEAIIVIDVLRRLKIQVDTLSCASGLVLKGYWGVSFHADALFDDHQHKIYDAVILPGGPQGARSLGGQPDVVEFIRRHQAADKWICSICSAGAHVLSANQLLQGRRYVCSGDNYKLYADGCYTDQRIVEDGKILSAKGLGAGFEFAFKIGEKLLDPQVVQELATHIYVDTAVLTAE